MGVEENWERLKAFQPFHYDKNLLQWNQDGNGPPPQFVSTDGAFGNPMCWEKLRNSAGKKWILMLLFVVGRLVFSLLCIYNFKGIVFALLRRGNFVDENKNGTYRWTNL